MARTIAAENTINGGFGELFWSGALMANVMSVEARATLNKRDIRIAGSRLTQYKAMDVRGEGSFTIYRVTSEFIENLPEMFSSKRPSGLIGNTEANGRASGYIMNINLKDPEILREQTESITLTRVKIWEIPFGFSVDELVQQTLQFTFEGVSRLPKDHLINYSSGGDSSFADFSVPGAVDF